MAEPVSIICAPVTFKGYVTPGSIRDKCPQCGELVWVSPSSWLILHDNPGSAIICLRCAAAELPLVESPTMLDPTPAQLDEVREYLERK